MASRRKGKNIKTHPDPDAGGFVDPQRTDLTGTSSEDPVVIDLNSGTEQVDLNASPGGDGGRSNEGAAADDAPARPQRVERQERTEDDADERHSDRVRKRIRRERNLLNRERQLREQTNKQLQDERVARQAVEARLSAVERKQGEIASNGGVKELESKIASLKAQLGVAIEAGDTAKHLDLTIQLGDAQSDLKLLRFKLENPPAQARATEREAADDTSGQPNALTAEELAAAGDWQESNKHWFRRSKWKEAREAAIEIDREILRDVRAGNADFDLYSDEHLEELSRRLREEFPDLPVVDAAGEDYEFEEDDVERDDGRGDRRNGGRQMNGRGERVERDRGGNRGSGARPGQGGIGTGGRRQPSQADLARQGKVQLDQADFNQMRTFGMDPNNADHKKAFAKERMRTILTEERGGSR